MTAQSFLNFYEPTQLDNISKGDLREIKLGDSDQEPCVYVTTRDEIMEFVQRYHRRSNFGDILVIHISKERIHSDRNRVWLDGAITECLTYFLRGPWDPRYEEEDKLLRRHNL